MNNTLRTVVVLFLIVFGAVTTFMTVSILFDLFGMAEKHGNYVPFVVSANLACGLLYLLSAYQLWRKQNATKMLFIALSILVITFMAFVIYVMEGGVHELKTFYALTFRLLVTAALVWVSKRLT
ncbi:MAG: hypothetical protein J5I52_01510 [Saprospiraceae bacterium]|nr:MAG: hypothetical protein UZ09_BCD002001372 [Bacteroidetes bacterium OLB9]MCO6462803.1 hypothetical protein [Saprospiraceae bacterium]MCZ2339346.1 hypothetical protein [Chitinophagales bacterium]